MSDPSQEILRRGLRNSFVFLSQRSPKTRRERWSRRRGGVDLEFPGNSLEEDVVDPSNGLKACEEDEEDQHSQEDGVLQSFRFAHCALCSWHDKEMSSGNGLLCR